MNAQRDGDAPESPELRAGLRGVPSYLVRFEFPLYIVLFAAVASYFRRYSIVSMASNQVSQLPLVMHRLDPEVLSNDWYVNAMSGVGTRTFFVELVAAVARVVGLEAAYFLLYLSAVLFAAALTYYATTRVFRASATAGLIAALLVMTWRLLNFGVWLQVVHADLVPAHLAKPLSLFAIVLALQGRGVACALVAGLTSFIHPLLGVMGGVLALGALAASAVVDFEEGWRPRFELDRRVAISAGLGFLCLLPFIVFWARLETTPIDLDRYLHIVAEVRNPHHYLPSSWEPITYLLVAMFLAAVGLLFSGWRKTDLAASEAGGVRLQSYLTTLAAGLGALCALGYLLVEVWPVRTVVTLQAFRYLYIAVWLGAIFTAIAVARVGARGSFAKCCAYCLVLLGGNSPVQPVLLLVGAGAYADWSRARDPEPKLGFGEATLVGLALWLILPELGRQRLESTVLLLSMILAAFSIFVLSVRRPAIRLACVGAAVTCSTLALLLAGDLVRPRVAELAGRLRLFNNATFERVEEDASRQNVAFADLVRIAAYARDTLPQDAVVLTPPSFGAFRIFAERAIVVDYKCWTFRDPEAWYRRMRNVYGDFGKLSGVNLKRGLDRAYMRIDDRRLDRIGKTYGAGFAVVGRKTATRHPTMFLGETYKLVEIQP